MDQDGSEHNICSNREGLCPGKEQHGASGWKKIFQHGKEPLRNKDSVSQYCNILQQKSRCFIDFERKCFGNFMHLLD